MPKYYIEMNLILQMEEIKASLQDFERYHLACSMESMTAVLGKKWRAGNTDENKKRKSHFGFCTIIIELNK